MGICRHCKAQINLKDNENICPKCGKKDPYLCWNCHTKIRCDEEYECKLCHIYECQTCGRCHEFCNKEQVINDIKQEYPELESKKIIKLIDIVALNLDGKIHRTCPIKGISISYAKGGKIKNIWKKVSGVGVKNPEDKNEFSNKLQKIIDLPLSTEITINQIRDNGTYGIEYREIVNLACCMGYMKKIKKPEQYINEKKIDEHFAFLRCEEKICPHALLEDLIRKKCLKCKKMFDGKNIEYCDICVYKKGKKKGQHIKLKEIKSEVEFCQLKRTDFIREKEEKKDGDVKDDILSGVFNRNS